MDIKSCEFRFRKQMFYRFRFYRPDKQLDLVFLESSTIVLNRWPDSAFYRASYVNGKFSVNVLSDIGYRDALKKLRFEIAKQNPAYQAVTKRLTGGVITDEAVSIESLMRLKKSLSL